MRQKSFNENFNAQVSIKSKTGHKKGRPGGLPWCAGGRLALGGLGGVGAGFDALFVGGAAGAFGAFAELLTHGAVPF